MVHLQQPFLSISIVRAKMAAIFPLGDCFVGNILIFASPSWKHSCKNLQNIYSWAIPGNGIFLSRVFRQIHARGRVHEFDLKTRDRNISSRSGGGGRSLVPTSLSTPKVTSRLGRPRAFRC